RSRTIGTSMRYPAEEATRHPTGSTARSDSTTSVTGARMWIMAMIRLRSRQIVGCGDVSKYWRLFRKDGSAPASSRTQVKPGSMPHVRARLVHDVEEVRATRRHLIPRKLDDVVQTHVT